MSGGDGLARGAGAAQGVTGDHELLVRRDHPRGGTATGSADAGATALVGCGVEFDAKPRGVVTHAGPDRHGVLADPAREHEGVEPAERGGERAELAPDPVDEHVERPGGARRATGEKV